MDILKVLKERRSIRKYKDKQVTNKIIEYIIDTARFVPTSNNVQPWEFLKI